MKFFERIASGFRLAAYLGRNPLSMAGAVLTSSSAATLIGFWLFDIVGGGAVHPYVGLVFFLILPGIFVIGLILIPAGAIWRRVRLANAGQLPTIYPRVDFSIPAMRQVAGWIGGLTLANGMILSVASYRSVEYMDSAKFCGQTCHTVMQPEYTAYQTSPHQRVACVQCHIGPGASWFVHSKLSGLRQVYAVTFHRYDQPIPSPVRQLRPSRDTCEQCHWPQVFTGNKLVVKRKFSDDEKNTELTTVLMLKIGGHTFDGGVGIHGRHLDVNSPIEYIATDRQRQTIAQVTYTDKTGKKSVFTSTDTKPTAEQLAAGEHRTMDCIDCHNRPTHTFQLPERALDDAMAQGRISPELPFIKKQAAALLNAKYADRDTAVRQIAASLDELLSNVLSRRVPREARAGGDGDQSGAGRVLAERVPRDECDLGLLSQQSRAHGLSRMLPLSRRKPYERRRQFHSQRLRHLPLDAGDGRTKSKNPHRFGPEVASRRR